MRQGTDHSSSTEPDVAERAPPKRMEVYPQERGDAGLCGSMIDPKLEGNLLAAVKNRRREIVEDQVEKERHKKRTKPSGTREPNLLAA